MDKHRNKDSMVKCTWINIETNTTGWTVNGYAYKQ